MKFNQYFRAAVVAAVLGHGVAFAGGEGWISDFEAAKKKAAEEKKSLLIDFTGSDWCGWCIKLNKEVFDHAAFKDGVKDKFVLVELDFPKDKTKVTEAVMAQNKELQGKYSVRGFPTILLTDAEGKPFAKTGYRQGGPEAYVTHLNELLAIREQRDAAFAEAGKAGGVAKAKALIKGVEAIKIDEKLLAAFYGDKLDAIKAADPKDETGYVKKLESKQKFEDFMGQINALGSKKDFEGAIKIIDETLAAGTFDGELKQQTLVFKAITFMQLKKPEDAIKSLDEAKAIDPEGPMAKNIDALKTKIQASVPK
jgi:thiol-disulfide isomerase/thioredoxin